MLIYTKHKQSHK